MGRWAQRRRCGGGESINFITLVEWINGEDIHVTYLLPVEASYFDRLDFTDNTSENPTFILQEAPNKLNLVFEDGNNPSGTITYSGDVPGVLNPQTVAY